MNQNIINKLLNQNYFITSDHHFGHLNVVKFEKERRNIITLTDNDINLIELKSKNEKDISNMEIITNRIETELINKWNQKIKDEDIVIYLGDFAINKMEAKMDKNLIKRLKQILSNIKNKKTLNFEDFQTCKELNFNFNTLSLSIEEYIKENEFKKTKKNVLSALNKLNGIKILIRGNHDVLSDEFYLNNGFDFVVNGTCVISNNSFQIIKNDNGLLCNCLIVKNKEKCILFSHFNVFPHSQHNYFRYLIEVEYLKKEFDLYKCDINMHGHTHSYNIDDKRCINMSIDNTNFYPIHINNLNL